MKSSGSASANRLVLAVKGTRDEPATGELPAAESTSNVTLLERVLTRAHLKRALKQVRSNRGAPGIDGMSVDELPGYLKEHWLEIRALLVAGSYRPQRSAHQAVRQLQAGIRAGKRWVVDLDLEAFFDRVSHDRLIVRLKRHVADRSLLRLINRYLKAGVRVGEETQATTMGVPQGGLLTPLGWKAYFGIAEVPSPLRDLDKWIRRKLRCYHWKQWGRAGYRELRRREVSVRDAWHTAKSAHGPWRLSQTPALALALPARHFERLGLPSLAAR